MKTKNAADNQSGISKIGRRTERFVKLLKTVEHSEVVGRYINAAEFALSPVLESIERIRENNSYDVRETLKFAGEERIMHVEGTFLQLRMVAAIETILTSPLIMSDTRMREGFSLKLEYDSELDRWARANMKPGAYNQFAMMDMYPNHFDREMAELHKAAITVAPKRKVLLVLGKEEREIERLLKVDPTWINVNLKESEGYELRTITKLLRVLRNSEKETLGSMTKN